MTRPVSDQEIAKANSLYDAITQPSNVTGKLDGDAYPVLMWGAWNWTHALSTHNQTYNDQQFLAKAWSQLKENNRDTLASSNLAHFLGGTGTPVNLSLRKLFVEDQKFASAFNKSVANQIYKAEMTYKATKRGAGETLNDFLNANLRSFEDVLASKSVVDFKKDYGDKTNIPYHGHVAVDQGQFGNEGWMLGTGGLTILWRYLDVINTMGSRQFKVLAMCLKQYKWHPYERRWSRLSHIAAENAKAPQPDRSLVQSAHGIYPSTLQPKSGNIALGSETIGQWKQQWTSQGLVQDTIYNPAKEFKLVFKPVEWIVPAYVPTSKVAFMG
ncbi:hypothetical protein GGQ73_004219 [Rhizobium skierniewicense]|uniref:Uncharacterized protein n=1 Tax=Rhizobium skierniewicense TaxID=984260 RepID=A0A7W6G3I9_9HYPH|nr:hypothetical protein [Rhizobium skierniewicense]MBB3948243.1 hypothetical protein [Rhizobium skierniewicense]